MSVLLVSDTALRFLGRNTAVSRTLGRSANRTRSFTLADNYDRDAESINSFRFGPPGPGVRGPVSSFRGVPTSSTLRLPGHDGVSVHETSPNREAVDSTRALDPFDSRFLGEQTVMRALFIATSPLAESFQEGDRAHGYRLREDFAAFARTVVGGTDRVDWRSQPGLARLVWENRAGLADRMNESEEVRALMNTSPDEVVVQQARERVREEVSSKLVNSSGILDEEFLRDNPLAALDLLLNPDRVQWVEEDSAHAEQYRKDAGLTAERMRDELPELADAEVQNGPFDDSWFRANLLLAEAVVADAALGMTNSFGRYLDSRANLLEEKAFAPDLAAEYYRREAVEAVGGEGVIPDSLFRDNVSLAMMTALDALVAAGLARDAEEIRVSYPEESARAPGRLAQQAYGLGLGERVHGDYARVA